MAKHPNYSRICAECENHTANGKFHTCNAPVNLITGQPAPQQCVTSRSDHGHCGPEGRHHVPLGLVGGTTDPVKTKKAKEPVRG